MGGFKTTLSMENPWACGTNMDGKFGKRFKEFRDLCFKLLGMVSHKLNCGKWGFVMNEKRGK